MKRGVFITVEGGEGVGKSTFCKSLLAHLRKSGKTCIFTREPGGTPVANHIRQIFVDPPEGESLDKLTEFCLVSAARAQHVAQVIRPALEAGQWIVCDRYSDSSRVYQGDLAGVEHSFLEQVIETTTHDAHPDVTFVLDCSEQTAMERVKARGGDQETTRFDAAGLETYRMVRQGFLRIAETYPQRVSILDAELPVDKLLPLALQALQAKGVLSDA